MRTARARTLVMMPEFHGVDFAAILREVRDVLPDLHAVSRSARRTPSPAPSRTKTLERSEPAFADDPNEGVPLVAFTTSGTTSAPNWRRTTRRARHATHATTRPHSSSRGRRQPVRSAVLRRVRLLRDACDFAGGGTVLAMPVFDGAAAARAIARHGSRTYSVPIRCWPRSSTLPAM